MKQGESELGPSVDSAVEVPANDDVQVSPLDDGAGWACVLVRAGLRVYIELADEPVGSGHWVPRVVEVRAVDGSVTVSRLRSVPYGEAIRLSRSAVTRVAATGSRLMFAHPSDPPVAFRSHRQGRSARTDEDYARLAWSYLSMQPEARRHAASRWAQDFPGGGSKRTWTNRLTRARRFVEGDGLTDEGATLVFGEDWQQRRQQDAQWDNALDHATMTLGGELWRKREREGKRPHRLRVAAQHAADVWVDPSGRAFPRSPQNPQESRDAQ